MNDHSSKQIKAGAILSYCVISFNMIAGLIYTPWMISKIGQSNYGLYTLATSLITMFLFDFGMSSAVSRFVSKFIAEGRQDKVNTFLGIVYKLYLIIDSVVLLLLVIIYFLINTIYGQLTDSEIIIFKNLYVIVGVFSVISFPFVTLNGILTSYEKFTHLRLCELFNKVFIIVSVVIALLCGGSVYALVLLNVTSGIITTIIKLIIVRKETPIRIDFKTKDKSLIKEIFSFSIWTTVSSLAQRMIYNLTPSVIAAVSITGSVGVAIFGLGSTIEGYVYSFATAINGMFVTRISKLVYGEKDKNKLTQLMIKVGRIQCMVIGLLVVGFIAVGRSFIIDIWNKPSFSESYICTILMIIPSYFFLPMQIANTTLVVENKVKLQAEVFVLMGVINVVLSILLAKYFGAIGASISIFIAYMTRTVLMGVIFQTKLGFDMMLFLKETFLKITPYLLIVMFIGKIFDLVNPVSNTIIRFIINGGVVICLFSLLMYKFVMNDYEKNMIRNILNRTRSIRRKKI